MVCPRANPLGQGRGCPRHPRTHALSTNGEIVARPKHKLKRDRQFNVSLTARELELPFERAAALGMRPVDYGRARLFSERHASVGRNSAGGPHLDPLFKAELSRLGNNLNQIARQLNKFESAAPPVLQPLLLEIRALINKGAAADDH